MANLVPVSSFDDVYQIETTDVVLGGPGEVANSQAQALANRTKYLKEALDAEVLKSQKVLFSNNLNVVLSAGNACVKLFRFKPAQYNASDLYAVTYALFNSLDFKINIAFGTAARRCYHFTFNAVEHDSNTDAQIRFRLRLNDFTGVNNDGATDYEPKFYLIVKRVVIGTDDYRYDFYFESKNLAQTSLYIQVACLDQYTNVYTGYAGLTPSILELVTFESSLTAIGDISDTSSGTNYITSIYYDSALYRDDNFNQLISQLGATSKTPSSWNNDYVIGGNSQKILYSGPKTVSLTTTNTAVKLFSYKYKLTATPLSAQRLDKSVKFDVHYGCTSDIFISVMRQYELMFDSEEFYLKLLKQTNDKLDSSPSTADNSPLDVYLIVKQRLDGDGYTYFDFYLDDSLITETRTKNIEVVVYDDVKESLRDKITFESTLSAVAKMYNVSSATSYETSIHSSIIYNNLDNLTNVILSAPGAQSHTPNAAIPVSTIGETRLQNIEANIGSLQLDLPIGSMTMYMGAGALPTKWLECNGQEVLISSYPTLASVLGTTWGSATSGYVRLPDMRGLFPRGAGTNDNSITGIAKANGTAFAGGSLGAYSNDQIQGHDHITRNTVDSTVGGSVAISGGSNGISLATHGVIADSAGTYGPARFGYETIPASAAVKYIIKAI